MTNELTREQWDALNIYRNYINYVGEYVPDTSVNVIEKLKPLNHYRFLMALIFGTEIVKEELKGLLVLDDYINQLHAVIETEGAHIVLDMSNYNEQSFGKMKELFSQRYYLKKNDPDLEKELTQLNTYRNNIVHNTLFECVGDLEKMEIKSREYIYPNNLIQILLDKLVAKFNIRREYNYKLEQEIRSIGLIK